MAGSKVNSYGVGDVNATSIMETLDAQRIGFHALTLTEFDTSVKPAIAAGSKIEINGALYKFDTEEAISGTPADGEVYILLTPSGSTVTASFTATAPTWSDSKQGWYGTGGSANYRYANFIMTKSTTNYNDKRYYQPDPIKKFDNFSADTFDFDTFLTKSIGANGYIKLGSLYIQWGTSATTSSSSKVVTFPLQFPNNVYSIVIGNTHVNNSGERSGAYVDPASTTTSQFTIVGDNSTMLTDCYWLAIGD